MGSKLILSAATAIRPFIGPDGKPLADVSAYAKLLNYVAVMNYDIWGPWSPTVGPNAPLNDACTTTENQMGSAMSAVKAWTGAGFPAKQLVLGVPGYGHSFRVREAQAFLAGSDKILAPYPIFDGVDRPNGDAWDDAAGLDVCGAAQLPGGNINYWGLIVNGFLEANGSPKKGIAYTYNECSQTVSIFFSGAKGDCRADDNVSHSSTTQRARSWSRMTMHRFVHHCTLPKFLLKLNTASSHLLRKEHLSKRVV